MEPIEFKNIDTVMGKLVSTLGDIPINMIFNAVSVRGPQIFKILENGARIGPDREEIFAVFEITMDDGDEHNSVVVGDDITETLSTYNFDLKIYGNNAQYVAQKIISRIRTEENIAFAKEKGIFIYKISFPKAINEFINNTLWPRADLNIKIQVIHSFEQKSAQQVINEMPVLSIKKLTIKSF